MATMYKTELHCHSQDGSNCSHESVEGICEKYLNYGYSTICLTNHFDPSFDLDDRDGWMAKIERVFSAYDKLKDCAGDRLNILMGLEFRFRQNSNDYLVFGCERKWLEDTGSDLMKMGVRRFTELARPMGIFTIHAHPFRFGMTTTPPEAVDGIEVFNGHPGHNSNNDIAEAWAKKYGKIMTSGTDHHDPSHMPDAGIRTSFPITTVPQLIETLKSGDYTLIRGAEDAKN